MPQGVQTPEPGQPHGDYSLPPDQELVDTRRSKTVKHVDGNSILFEETKTQEGESATKRTTTRRRRTKSSSKSMSSKKKIMSSGKQR